MDVAHSRVLRMPRSSRRRPRNRLRVTRIVLAAATAIPLLAAAGPAGARTPSVGYMSICKQESGTGLEGIVFNFSVQGRAYSAPVGGCTPTFRVKPGHVTATEVDRPGARFVSASAAPAGRLVGVDKAKRTATVNVVAGDQSKQTIVTFTNAAVAGTGYLKLCNVAGPGVAVGTRSTFTVGGRTVDVTAGPQKGGGYCVIVDAFRFGRQTITEKLASHQHVAGIAVSPSGRLVAKDLRAARVTVSIGSGTTTTTYTNARSG